MGLFSGERLHKTSPPIINIEGFGSPDSWSNLPNSLRGSLRQYNSDILIACNVGRKRSRALKHAVEQIQPQCIANPNSNIGYRDLDISAILEKRVIEENGILRIADSPITFNRLIIASGRPEEDDYVESLIIPQLVKNFSSSIDQIITVDMFWH